MLTCGDVPRDNWHQNCFGFDGLKICLRQEAHTHRAKMLGEHNSVFANAHGTGLKSIAIVPDRLVALYFNLLAVSKPATKNNKHNNRRNFLTSPSKDRCKRTELPPGTACPRRKGRTPSQNRAAPSVNWLCHCLHKPQ